MGEHGRPAVRPLLARRRPLRGADRGPAVRWTLPASVALERLRVKPRPLTSIAPTVPRSLEEIVMRLLARTPDMRPASAGELAAELDVSGSGSSVGFGAPGTGHATAR